MLWWLIGSIPVLIILTLVYYWIINNPDLSTVCKFGYSVMFILGIVKFGDFLTNKYPDQVPRAKVQIKEKATLESLPEITDEGDGIVCKLNSSMPADGVENCTPPETNEPKQQQVYAGPIGDSAHFSKGTVTRVVDGDTVILNRQYGEDRIRLASIDAPEKTQAYGLISKTELESIVLNKEVTLENLGKDQYSRIIGILTLDDGTSVNELMVKRGAAWFCAGYYNGVDYSAAHKKAYESRIGLWSESSVIPPWLYRSYMKNLDEKQAKQLIDGGLYLDSQGTLHNSKCASYYQKYRWDGISKHPNCQRCGGSILK